MSRLLLCVSIRRCDPEEYEGPFPFSEPETRAVKCLVEANQFKCAVNLHSFGNIWVHPFNCCPDEVLPDDVLNIYHELKL